MNSLAAIHRDRRGVTSMEYGVITALIAVVILASTTNLGVHLMEKFEVVSLPFHVPSSG